MKARFYFGVPYTYEYEWGPDAQSAYDVLNRILGTKVIFICRSAIYDGYVYGVEAEEDEIIILKLKCQFELIENRKAEEYINRFEAGGHGGLHEINKLKHCSIQDKVSCPD